MPTTRTTRAHLVGGALALSLALSACGGATPAGAPAPATPSASAQVGVSTEHNEADIRFAQMMIPHHRQAVAMAGIAVDRAENPDVRNLAEQIRAAQDPEIERMTGFLQAWGAEVPAEEDMFAMPGMSGMDHSAMSGPMTPEQMNELQGAGGAEFDRMYAYGFSDKVRDFRNYVHPSVQLENNFTPDGDTVLLSWAPVLAVINDLRSHAAE